MTPARRVLLGATLSVLGVAVLGFLAVELVKFKYACAWAQVNEAKAFCESLIPALEAHKRETGRYPQSVDGMTSEEGKIPSLIQSMIRSNEPWYWPTNGEFEFRFHGDQFFSPGLIRYQSGTSKWVMSSG